MKILFCLLILCFCFNAFSQELDKPLPAWQEGILDLHHINTGRGDAAFYLLPAGTTFLLDAGEMSPDNSPRKTPPHSPEKYRNSKVRNIKSNGSISTGRGTEVEFNHRLVYV